MRRKIQKNQSDVIVKTQDLGNDQRIDIPSQKNSDQQLKDFDINHELNFSQQEQGQQNSVKNNKKNSHFDSLDSQNSLQNYKDNEQIRVKLLPNDQESERAYLNLKDQEQIIMDEIQQEHKQKKIEEKEKYQFFIQHNFYRFCFLFSFAQALTLFATIALQSEFNQFFADSLEIGNTDAEGDFMSKYPNLLSILTCYLVLNCFIMIVPIGTCILINRWPQHYFNIYILLSMFLYFGKFVNNFALLIVDEGFNNEYSNLYQTYASDKETYCSTATYYQCRIVFAWNFFKYIAIIDAVIASSCFVTFCYYSFLYKRNLVQEYQVGKKVEKLEEQESLVKKQQELQDKTLVFGNQDPYFHNAENDTQNNMVKIKLSNSTNTSAYY